MTSSINAQTRHEENGGVMTATIPAATVTVGVNLGPWRLRADWQTGIISIPAVMMNETEDTPKEMDWSRYYARRALPSFKSQTGTR